MIFQMCLFVMVITTLPRRNADSAASEAAGLVWGHLARQVADPNATATKLARALVPVYGVTWNRAVITSTAVGGTTEINRVCCLLRNSNLARSEYGRLVAFVLEAYSYSSLFPPEMSEWRELAHRHRLEMHFPWGQLLAISLQLVSAGFPLPSNLDEVNIAELHAMASAPPSRWLAEPCGRRLAQLLPPFPQPVNTSPLPTSSSPRTATSWPSVDTLRSLRCPARSLCAQRRNVARPAHSTRWGPPSGFAFLARPLFFLARLAAISRTSLMSTC